MATNVTLTTSPDLWSSAYSDIEFVFDFDEINISSATNPSGTITRITVATAFAINPPVNSYCYIDSGIYLGLWRVLASTSTTVDLNVTYTANQTTGTLKSLRVPTFSLYKGFKVGEQFPTELPYTLVTSFTHNFNSSYQLAINLKGLLQRIFTIEEPDLNSGIDFSVFNGYRLVWDSDNETDLLFVLNCSIPTSELNDSYLTNGLYLSNNELPLKWGCGVSFMTKFVDGFPTLEIYNGGTLVTGGFNLADFLAADFDAGFDIN